jgi:hypothetical protein
MITWTCYSAADATAVGNFDYARWSHAACAPPVAVDINKTTLFDSSMSRKSVTAQSNRIPDYAPSSAIATLTIVGKPVIRPGAPLLGKTATRAFRLKDG